MISEDYNIKEFINEVKDKEYEDIMELTIIEVRTAEKRSAGVKGAVKAREQGIGEYIKVLKGLAFFLRQGIKPAGVDDYYFKLFQPICQNLVEKKTFKSSIMEFFD